MKKRILPSIDEVIYAMSEEPLGEGDEAKVYKVHTNPDYTVRVSNEAPDLETLSQMMYGKKFIEIKDIFAGRNFAQSVAYINFEEYDILRDMLTLNLYAPGFSIEIYKPGKKKPESSEALMKELALSNGIKNMPNSAMDDLFDQLHFLSSREHSIDVGNGGPFTNTGNILCNWKDKKFSIIDVQPFIRERVGIPANHTKGFNTPLFLTRGLIPGMYEYAKEHSKYPPLIACRTEIVDKVIKGAERNHLNDVGGYLAGDADAMALFWKRQLDQMCIPEKYQENFIKRICSVKQEQRYQLVKSDIPLIRVAGRSMYS